MRRQMRSRRSDSSCSIYSHHSNSLAHLQPLDFQHKDKKDQIKFSQIDAIFYLLYQSMKPYQTQNSKPDINNIKQWRKNLRNSICKLRSFNKQNQQALLTLKTNMTQMQQSKSTQIRNLRVSQEQELKELQQQNSKNIGNMIGEFVKKQQQYKQIIAKIVQTLQQSQKNWNAIQDQLQSRVKKAQQLLRHRAQVDAKNYLIYEQVSNFAQQLCIQQPDDSLRSINLSHEQIAPQIPKLYSRRNTIDISSIQHFQDPEDEHHTCHDGFEDCLVRMICWGFFLQKNQSNIKKIIEISRNLQDYQLIIKQPIFPILIQAIKLNLDFGKSPSTSLNHNSDISCQNVQHIVMRDIENQKIIL